MDMDMERPSSTRPKFDELLGAPLQGKEEVSFNRCQSTFASLDSRFHLAAQRSFDRQYAQLYFARLLTLVPVMHERVAQEWPDTDIVNILDLQENKEVAVIGTVYKAMRLKPSVLDEYSKDRGLKAALAATNFCSDDDHIILEDEGARMVVRGDCLPVADLVTGVVMSVRGYHEPGGDFIVNACCFPGLAPQPPLPVVVSDDKYVALMSGLAVGTSRSDNFKIQLAVDFLTGNLGSPAEQQLAARVVRLVVAGGLVGQLEALSSGPGGPAGQYNRQRDYALQPVKDLDMYLAELATGLHVDVMPGPEDPTNVALPQQPLHRCLFPSACSYGSFTRSSNPHECELDGVRLLGTSGQGIDDIAKYARGGDRLDLLERCLMWRHLAPTAPDTLTCYPFHDQDPFILPESPHIMFAGGQPEFATRLVSGAPAGSGSAGSSGASQVRLICVPSFARTGTIVLVNLRTLQCHPITFGSGMES